MLIVLYLVETWNCFKRWANYGSYWDRLVLDRRYFRTNGVHKPCPVHAIEDAYLVEISFLINCSCISKVWLLWWLAVSIKWKIVLLVKIEPETKSSSCITTSLISHILRTPIDRSHSRTSLINGLSLAQIEVSSIVFYPDSYSFETADWS